MSNKTDITTEQAGDKAGEAYWTKVWGESPLPKPINIHSWGINQHMYRALDRFFKALFKGVDTKNKTILEIGCGNSVFLTYFHQEFGLQIFGLDYSELGCMQTRRIFERDGVKGEIYLGDAFAPPAELIGRFDYVVSLGVAEHFEDTSKALRAFAEFVKPGGVVITSVPNLVGLTGYLQERISFAPTLEGLNGERIPHYTLKNIISKTIRYSMKLLWVVENIFGSFPERKLLSAGIINAARKKGG
jgi:2-polyprenyl-3-methyl-5-hydroxy-6-metoxy-1,4-benzoquinol methylase